MQASLRYALLKLLKCLTDDEVAATETSKYKADKRKDCGSAIKNIKSLQQAFIVVVCACTGLLGSCVLLVSM